MSDNVTTERQGSVLVTSLDDGKANVLTHGVLHALHGALDDAERDDTIGAVVVAGRPGSLSGGFDLKEMTASPQRCRDLVVAGARLHLRVFTFPKPVVVAATGHAVAAGAILLLAADWNVGSDGSFRIGLPETAIGMPLPRFAIELARARLSPAHLTRATSFGEMYDPNGAVEAGYLDAVADDAVAAAVQQAEVLATTVHQPAFALTKQRLHGELAAAIESHLVDDVTALTMGARDG